MTVHEEVDDLVEFVRLLDEHHKFLLAATRSFHLIFVYFFRHNQPGIRAFESPPGSQRRFALFACPKEYLSVRFQSFVSEFCDLLQRVAPFYLETLTTTTHQTTSLLVRSDRLVFGMRQRASDRLRRRRNPCLWGTVARGTVARSRT